MIKNEDELFTKLKKYLINDLEKTNSKFDRTDCTTKEYNATIELKCRKTHYNDLLIEKDKYDAIMNSKTKNKKYIVSTPQGVFSFDLTKIKQPVWLSTYLPATTERMNNNIVKKKVGYLNIETAKDISIFLN